MQIICTSKDEHVPTQSTGRQCESFLRNFSSSMTFTYIYKWEYGNVAHTPPKPFQQQKEKVIFLVFLEDFEK